MLHRLFALRNKLLILRQFSQCFEGEIVSVADWRVNKHTHLYTIVHAKLFRKTGNIQSAHSPYTTANNQADALNKHFEFFLTQFRVRR